MYEKNRVAIFVPREYDELREAMRTKHKVLSDVLLYTGMRYTEARRIERDMYDRNKKYIFLSSEVDKKRKRVTPDRYVHLSTLGRKAMDRFFEETYEFPTYIAFDQMLNGAVKRAGLTRRARGLAVSVKAFRKTWECWLAVSYPERIIFVVMSQGHSEMVAMQHYLNVPFSTEEKRDIREHVSGWMVE